MASREKEEALEHLLYQAMQQPDGEVILLLMATVVCILVPISFVQSLVVILAVLWGIGGMVVTQVGIRYFELREKLSVEIITPIFKREGKEG